jgi:transposase
MAVSTALRGDNQIAHFHSTLVNKGKRPMAAHAAAMRKLLTIMRAILITERAYDPQQGIGGKLCGKTP